MDVLVTGHRGMIGAAVTRLLCERGDTVVGFDLADGQDVRNPAELAKADRDIEVIVHLAAADDPDPQALPGLAAPNAADAWTVLQTNVLGAANVLEAARQAGHARVVLMSTVEVLGVFDGSRAPDYLPLNDDHPCRPASSYAVSKLLAEDLCEAFTTATGITTVCLRPPGVFTPDTYRIIGQARVDNPDIEWSPLWQYGAFLDVCDLADAVGHAVHTNPLAGHHRLLLCADDISSARLASRELVSKLLPNVAWRGGNAYDFDPYRALLDCARARAVLDWQPQRRWRPGPDPFDADTGLVMMNAADALAVIKALEAAGVDVWLGDGGWGIDALLGQQTRPHKDIDLIVRVDQALDLVTALGALGYAVAEGQLMSCFVLRDHAGKTVDVHPVVFDRQGNGEYTMENREVWVYAAPWFAGTGTIRGQTVRCLTPQGQVRCHTGYPLDDDDRTDMAALRQRFGVDLLPGQH
ncbi:nucleotidyltransferase domain-containing protein [Mycobacterium attenuatum]|uniref:nucleotidyltransferase domain-containing protein n=1 Tax=Mycobacterium attenuatum TaxID=2341086 RepID=UPI000F0444AF|nr:NAD-dependent epimerase/dehydratase family protein [Mycobacterium attenuatum]VBA57507.1 Lincosamide resistance protein [Mycobacterium attenuatum]